MFLYRKGLKIQGSFPVLYSMGCNYDLNVIKLNRLVLALLLVSIVYV